MLMSLRRGWALPLAYGFFLLGSIICGSAQTETATLSGRVFDPSGLGIVGAQVSLTDIDRNTSNSSYTSNTGLFTFSSVRPGRYRLQVSATGFSTVNLTNLTVNAQDSLQQNFKLAVGSISESVTVEASSTPLDVSGTVGTVVDQQIIREAPLNGRSFQTLFQLTPGVVIAATDFANQGQFSVNGERTDANYFTVDGASANATIAAGTFPGQTVGGALPALSTAGGTNSLVSVDAVQEFAIQTSSFAPEYGRTPGAQVSVVTKSGTNELHGNAFDYLRNDLFDANDWFANHDGLKRPELRQNDFGGTLGGPIFRNRTFFFFSYEGLRLRQPTTGLSEVPSLAARSAAIPEMQPFLNSYPVPTGPDEGNGLAPANYSFSNPSTLNATSLRLDHHFTRNLSGFARYNYSPSSAGERGSQTSLSVITDTAFTLQTLTIGLADLITPAVTNDARLNWTRLTASSIERIDDFGGAAPLPVNDSIFPVPFNSQNSAFSFFPDLSGLNIGLNFGRNVANVQRQLNFLDNLSLQKGSHLLRLGVDYRRLTPHYQPSSYVQGADFLSIADSIRGAPAVVATIANTPVDSIFNNYSAYIQDTWTPVPRLTATYGVRWDYNPTPTARGQNGLLPLAFRNTDNPQNLSLAPSGASLYHSTWNNFAPRVGFAYQLRTARGRETVLKAGTGVFYDLGNGPSSYAFSFAPFSSESVLFPANYPLSPAQVQPLPITRNPPFSIAAAFPNTLRLPYSYHWNLSLEQAFGSNQSLTLGYVGSAGHSLVRTSADTGSDLPPSFGFIELFTIDNSSYSHYDSLQAQYRRRTGKGLDLVASYTLSHALDNGSSDANGGIPERFIRPQTDYGPADFDIRHTASVALSYEVPTLRLARVAKAFFGGWGVDPVFIARSAPPVNVVISRDIGFGQVSLRPDRVPGVPLYIYDPAAPGGRILNQAAFLVPSESRQGTLGRNALRGFSLVQLDFAVRRSFVLTERVGLDARVEAFNLLNRANFAPPLGQLGTVDPAGNLALQNGFGASQSVLSRGLQNGSLGAGFNPLYQIGGPRSLQLALKVHF